MLDFLSDAIFAVLYIFAAYFALISVFGLFKPRKATISNEPLRFAALIPARNEELCISCVVESLLQQNYPADKLDIFVIPNNCTDDTASAALLAGAQVIVASNSANNKGSALRQAMGLLINDYDAFCVFDADNEVDAGFIAAMNHTLQSGANVAKSRILAKNRHQNWVCGCYEIFFCFANRFLNNARGVLGLSSRVIGTGFAVRSSIIRELGGWTFESITEDAEFFAACVSFGEKIAWCGEAITYDEEPSSFRTSLTQRMRWVSGIMQVAQNRLPELIKTLTRPKSFMCALDAIMQFLFCYVQALLPFGLLFSAFADPAAFLANLPLSVLTGYLAGLATALVSMILEKRLTLRMLTAALMYPIFMASFIPLQTLSLFHRTTSWIEISHTGMRRKETENAIS